MEWMVESSQEVHDTVSSAKLLETDTCEDVEVLIHWPAQKERRVGGLANRFQACQEKIVKQITHHLHIMQ